MSNKTKNNKTDERSVEEYKVLGKVYNANWRDDVEAQIKTEEKSIKEKFEFYDNEKSYDSRRNEKTERVKRFQIVRKMRAQALARAIDAVMR